MYSQIPLSNQSPIQNLASPAAILSVFNHLIALKTNPYLLILIILAFFSCRTPD